MRNRRAHLDGQMCLEARSKKHRSSNFTFDGEQKTFEALAKSSKSKIRHTWEPMEKYKRRDENSSPS